MIVVSAKTENAFERNFKVTSIEKTDPPEGSTDDQTWFQYTIGQGDSAITGKRAGSLSSVRKHAREFAKNLNQRSAAGYSAYAPRKAQK